jgi:hypothetical protein
VSPAILVVPGGGGGATTIVEDYREYLGRSHGVRSRILASINGSPFSEVVPMVDATGTVTVEPGTGRARSLKVHVRADVGDVLVDPFAVEWQAHYGITTPDGSVLWVPVGTFVLTDVQQTRPGVLEVSASDRWIRVTDARFERARVTSGDTVAAIRTLLLEAHPGITVDTTRAPAGSHRRAVWDRDRDKAVQQLARSIGAQVRFDAEGVAVVAPVPTILDDPFWTVGRGRGGVKLAALGGASTRRTYNAVVVIGESPGGDPVIGVARETKVGSRTQYGGRGLGKRPRFVSTDLITTTAQANTMAAGLLARALTYSRTLTVDALPHPGLDAGHVLQVETDPGVWETHLTGGFDLHLGTSAVRIETASQTEEVEGE